MHQHLGLNLDNPGSAASTSGLQTPPVTQQHQHQHLQHHPQQQQHQPLMQAKGPQSRAVGSFPAPPTDFYFLLGSDSPFFFFFF